MVILTKVNKKFKELYIDNDKCIHLVNKCRNFILYNNNYFHYYEKFEDYYINYSYNYNKLYKITYYNYLRELHREDGPSIIFYNDNGEIDYKLYYLNYIEYSYKDYILKIKKIF